MLTPNYGRDIPEMTVKIAKAAFPNENAAMTIRNELGHYSQMRNSLPYIPQSDSHPKTQPV